MAFVFICSICDAQFPKWAGRCTECGKWGTIAQQQVNEQHTAATMHAEAIAAVSAATPVQFSALTRDTMQRKSTGIPECDRVLGGGLVPGSLVLLGGDPGIGKSTLVAQIAAGIGESVLYVSGEESAGQVKLRLDRLHIPQERLEFLNEEHVEVICKTILETQPALVIIDSIQTVASSGVDSEPGSVQQIKASTVRFLEIAKSSQISVMLIGHVTKGGELGGPKTLEHMVDTVLYLEGDRHQHFRILRATKNRFGSTNEVGIFDMQERGLRPVENPSALFLEERSQSPGACITAVVEGSRVLLVEVQALVNRTTFGFPQRKCSGFDVTRLNVLLAVLERRAGISFSEYDVYMNIVGGESLTTPAMDTAVCLALVSALYDHAVPATVVAWGEVGLGGELRSVSRREDRTKEAKRFGMTRVIAPPQQRTLADAITASGLRQEQKKTQPKTRVTE